MTTISYKSCNMLLVCAATLLASLPVHSYESPVHVFSIQDIQGGFDGSTFAEDKTILCNAPDSPVVCTEPMPMVDKEGITLWPIDSEFGFHVVDFLGAQEKVRDGIYTEGFAGNITDGDTVIGVKIANAKTDKYKVKTPYGTWCQALGGTSIKCSTEHYSALEHVLSCHEVIPYGFANPDDGAQKVLTFPDGTQFDCAGAELDNELYIVGTGDDTAEPPLPPELFTSAIVDDQMAPNDNTTVLEDIAVGDDYSVTLKDDGKVLYRWGGMIKRPNDVRMYAKLDLPAQWTDGSVEALAGYNVTKAHLVVNHWITNNPNDQLRPEDLENEAATGRKPDYHVVDGQWVSPRLCYEGDSDLLEVNSVLKNDRFSYEDGLLQGVLPPQPFSSDLLGGFTNAYYTTINRDPFEWSYLIEDVAPVAGVEKHEFYGTLAPLTDETGYTLVSGPRWRLRANKFGQDLPGLEIPVEECSPPPFTKENIKYETGELVTTTINLLDWADENSPLKNSLGWIDTAVHNTNVELQEGTNVSTNGLPMTEGFDLAVYIKGDRKPTAVFDAKLIIEFEGDDWVDPGDPPADLTDVSVTLTAETEVIRDATFWANIMVENFGTTEVTADLDLTCTTNREEVIEVAGVPESVTLAAFGSDTDTDVATKAIPLTIPADTDRATKIDCTVTATVADDYDLDNNTGSVTIKVVKP